MRSVVRLQNSSMTLSRYSLLRKWVSVVIYVTTLLVPDAWYDQCHYVTRAFTLYIHFLLACSSVGVTTSAALLAQGDEAASETGLVVFCGHATSLCCSCITGEYHVSLHFVTRLSSKRVSRRRRLYNRGCTSVAPPLTPSDALVHV